MIIYKTTNLVNGKIYVGLDTHNNPNYLGSGVVLRHSINKYGASAFSKEVIDEVADMDELNKKEIYWIETLNSTDRSIGYNIAKGGNGLVQFARDSISRSLKGRKQPQEVIQKRTKTLRENIASGKTIPSMLGKSHNDAWKNTLSCSNSGVGNLMYGRTVYGIWLEKYGKEEADRLRELKRQRASAKGRLRKDSDSHKRAISDANSKKVMCIDLNIEFKSVTIAREWLKEKTGKPGNIYAVCLGTQKTSGGYSWKYID